MKENENGKLIISKSEAQKHARIGVLHLYLFQNSMFMFFSHVLAHLQMTQKRINGAAFYTVCDTLCTAEWFRLLECLNYTLLALHRHPPIARSTM